ncbi:Acetyl esterase/lipase [Flavobacterium fluvii]|uniref:Acetyl esterase/lipase n=1 Tax=Flavobacterium fluvii TaxID=468056 RepID=A0A1M5E677_9FLAO|nr:alpha/beta hydrolase [Flavobacterium fluvii]SHF74654.1 Acetyl esterase/lipase [Flavobacterium fluvii]
MQRLNVFFILILVSVMGFAQQPIPRDTSFTVRGTFVKEKKHRPYIEIARPEMSEEVAFLKDQVYKKREERELTVDVYYPKKKIKGNYPGVILIHGGGWRSGDKSQTGSMAIALANSGYVAVCVEYRLSLEAKYPEAVYDIKSAIRWMRANSKMLNLDTKKISTLGMSAGGQLATLVGFTNFNKEYEDTVGNPEQSSAIQAVVNIDGTLSFHHRESKEGTATSSWLNCTYEENPKIWESASPLDQVSKHSPPIVFINSSIPRYHAGRDDMIQQLNSFHVYSEVHTLADTPHPFWFFHPWFTPTVNHAVAFLDKIFKN